MNDNIAPPLLLRMLMHRVLAHIAVAAVLCAAATAQPKSVKHKISVETRLSQDKVHAGSSVSAAIIADIEQGWHINSPTPADENLIPTTLAVQRGDVLDSVEINFPQGHEVQFGFADVPLEVFDGTLLISLKLHIATKLQSGTYTVPVTLRYQACSDNVCLPPAMVQASIELIVVEPSESVKRLHPELFGEGK